MPLHTHDQRSDEWHKARAGRITASVAAACLGLDPYESPIAAWKTITGRKTFEGNRHTQWGVQFEGPARGAYEVLTGNLVFESGFWVHAKLSWLGASPDGLVGPDGGVEIKCPSRVPEAIPQQHEIQMRICMAVCERSWWDYFAWSHDGEFLQRVERDLEQERILLWNLAAWYDAYVLTDKQPPRRKKVKL